eukprot:m.55324 g.55324  ORF g.55324 m.55324 type:complete len:88 (-) comp10978_c0_seq2:2304-2567(-)
MLNLYMLAKVESLDRIKCKQNMSLYMLADLESFIGSSGRENGFHNAKRNDNWSTSNSNYRHYRHYRHFQVELPPRADTAVSSSINFI